MELNGLGRLGWVNVEQELERREGQIFRAEARESLQVTRSVMGCRGHPALPKPSISLPRSVQNSAALLPAEGDLGVLTSHWD